MKAMHKQKGVAAVEFGLVLIPLVLLAFGITEFGRAMYQYNTIAKATRDSARYMSMQTPGDAAAHTAAKNLVVCGQIVCIRPGEGPDDPDVPIDPLVPGLTTDKVHVKDSSTDAGTHALQPPPAGVANLVTVEVTSFKFVSLVSFVTPDITFGTIGTTMFGPPPS